MKVCKVKGCNRIHGALGYCLKHYNQMRTFGEIRAARKRSTCSVEGCENPVKAKGLCHSHYCKAYIDVHERTDR